MWKIDSDGQSAHFIGDNSKVALVIKPSYTVTLWEVVPNDNPIYKIKWQDTPLETFDTEEAARAYIKMLVEQANTEDIENADSI